MLALLKFVLSACLLTAALPVYLTWARAQADAQIDRMQEAAFNTPGAEAPVTPSMLAGGLGLIGLHFLWSRILGLARWQAAAAFVMGSVAGIGLFRWQQEKRTP